MDRKLYKGRRYLYGAIAILSVVYMLGTDPDLGWAKNLSFGAGLVMWLGGIILSLASVAIIDLTTEVLLDKTFGNNDKLIDEVHKGNQAAGLALIARAIVTGLIMITFAMIIGIAMT